MADRALAEIPWHEDQLVIEPTVLRSWEIKDSHHSILTAEVEGNLLSIKMASGQAFRLSISQGDALMLALNAWKRVR